MGSLFDVIWWETFFFVNFVFYHFGSFKAENIQSMGISSTGRLVLYAKNREKVFTLRIVEKGFMLRIVEPEMPVEYARCKQPLGPV